MLAAREVDAPAVIVPPAPHDAVAPGSYLAATDPDGSGAAVLAALARLAAHNVGALPGPHRRRGHRQLRQDLDQGPAGRRPRAARPDRRPARVVQQRARPALDGAARRRRAPATWCWSCPPAARGTSPRCAASRSRGSAWCSTSAARTSASSARADGDRRGEGRAGRGAAAAADGGVAVLNADDPPVAAMAARTAGPGGDRRAAPERAGAGRGRRRWTPAARRFRLVTPRGLGGRRAAPGRRAPRRQRPGRRGGGARAAACTPEGVAAALSAAGPASRWRMEVTERPGRRHGGQRRLQREPRVDARGAAGAGRRSRAGPPAAPGPSSAAWASWATPPPAAHAEVAAAAARARGGPAGRVGRRRRRSTGAGARARVAAVRRRRAPSRCCARSWSPATSCWSRRPAPPAWTRLAEAARPAGPAGAASREGRPRRRGRRARGLDPAHPVPDPVLRPAGLRPGDPRRGPAEPQGQARHAHDGRRGDHDRHLGRLPRRRTG